MILKDIKCDRTRDIKVDKREGYPNAANIIPISALVEDRDEIRGGIVFIISLFT